MKRIPFFAVPFLLAFAGPGMHANGQSSYFVYLQTGDNTPFYIRMGGKVFSSTAAGYLLLGKLTDSLYPFQLGLVGNNEIQEYALKVEGKDAGYTIRKVDGQRWAMINLQTGQTQYSMEWQTALDKTVAPVQGVAAALPVLIADTVQKAGSSTVASSASAQRNLGDPERKSEQTASIAGVAVATQVGSETSQGRKPTLDMEFSMLTDSAKDPVDSTSASSAVATPSRSAQNDSIRAVTTLASGQAIANNGTDSTIASGLADTYSLARDSAPATTKRMPCGSLVGREEVDNLLIKAAAKTDVDEKIRVFSDGVNGQCITTSNIRKIAKSLASDVGRFKLLKAMYPFALNYYTYKDLSDLLTDKYYLAEFNKIIQQ